jgi:multidrug efflux pump
MKEISGALVGTTAVIWAVFIPITFFSGSVGVIYRQFAVTISVAMAQSLFIALSLSPAMCAAALEQGAQQKQSGFFGVFNKGFNRLKSAQATALERLLGNKTGTRVVMPLLFIAITAAAAYVFIRIPTSFLPDEDQGRMYTLINGPVSSTPEQTVDKNAQVEDFFLNQTNGAVEGLFTAAGFSFAGNSQNVGIAFVKMKEWKERGEAQSVFAISRQAGKALSAVKDAVIIPIVPPAVSSLGNTNGFEVQLIDRGNLGQQALADARGQLIELANQSNSLTQVRFNGLQPSPQYDLNIDSEKARASGVANAVINQTLSTALGGFYVNDFLQNGRTKRVYVQADAPYRMLPEDVERWYVRNQFNDMVPVSTFLTGEWSYGPPQVTRFNGNLSNEIQGQAVTGVSSGEALTELEQLAEQLPDGIDIAWTGLSYEEKQSGEQVWMVYLIALLAVFLVLAALYESWAIPLSIILTIPLGILGAVLSTWLTGQANDIYFQIGLLMTIALQQKTPSLSLNLPNQIGNRA